MVIIVPFRVTRKSRLNGTLIPVPLILTFTLTRVLFTRALVTFMFLLRITFRGQIFLAVRRRRVPVIPVMTRHCRPSSSMGGLLFIMILFRRKTVTVVLVGQSSVKGPRLIRFIRLMLVPTRTVQTLSLVFILAFLLLAVQSQKKPLVRRARRRKAVVILLVPILSRRVTVNGTVMRGCGPLISRVVQRGHCCFSHWFRITGSE